MDDKKFSRLFDRKEILIREIIDSKLKLSDLKKELKQVQSELDKKKDL